MKLVLVFSSLVVALACSAQADTPPRASNAPEFTHVRADEWINSKPLALGSLRGKIVLVEFWTFDCINCLRSAAWIKKVASEKSGQGLVVVGVHTPELPEERDVSNVRRAVGKLGITYPVMIDGDYSYWKAMGNQYWPAFYLIDADGKLRSMAIGEMHVGESRALQLERMIDELLPPRSSSSPLRTPSQPPFNLVLEARP
ncbi:MAG: redoxin family protein [Gammaproteobacteria bacterium]